MISKQQAKEAVLSKERESDDSYSGSIHMVIGSDDAVSAIDAIPEPQMGEEGPNVVVEAALAKIEKTLGQHEMNEWDAVDRLLPRMRRVIGDKVKEIRAALAVVREHDRREEDSLRRELADHLEGTEGVRRAIVKAQEKLDEAREVLREVFGHFGGELEKCDPDLHARAEAVLK